MHEFRDREEAGTQLATRLSQIEFDDPVVLALPRGGVPVARPVARALGAPLDLLMVRKIGVPGHQELAAGAIVEGKDHQVVFNDTLLAQLGLSTGDFDTAIADELKTIEVRRASYLAGRVPVPLAGRDVIIVDDGIATGATVKAALKGLSHRNTASLTLAVPVAPAESVAELRPFVDRLICLTVPEPFNAVGQHYVRFGQVSDAEVIAALSED